MKPSRNAPCPCGSGKKYKHCCADREATAPVVSSAALLQSASRLHVAGRLAEAEAGYRRILSSAPKHADALHGLGVIAFQSGRLDDACQLIDQAVRHKPGMALFHFNLGKARAANGQYDGAEAAYRQALALDPAHLPSIENLGNLLLRRGRYPEAAQRLALAHKRQPERPATQRAYAMALWWSGRLVEAARRYAPVAEGPSARLRLALMQCATVASGEAMQAARARLLTVLDEVEAAAPLAGEPTELFDVTCFYPTYHGLDERPLLARLGQVLARACPSLAAVAPHCRANAGVRAPGRLRIGVVSAFFGNHSVSRYFEEMLCGIDRERFELWLFGRDDEAGPSPRLRAHADHVHALQYPLQHMQQAVAEARLDLLLYLDLGMHPATYLLAFARLAPVQVATYGHPVTSGVPQIDAFLSHAALEPADAAAHYSERLHLLPGESTFSCHACPEPGASALTRDDLGLDAAAHVYLCAQNLTKLHPDLDPILLDILQQDPAAVVALVDDRSDLRPQLEARFATSLGGQAGRVRFLPFQRSGEDYYRLYALADVVLDSLHFSGGVTSFDAFAMGAAVVTLPGASARGRQTAALYRQMEIADCIATDAADYARIALRLGTDADYRAGVRAAIASRRPRIFGDRRIIDDWNQALAALAVPAEDAAEAGLRP